MYSYGSPHTAAQKQDDQHERTFSSYVRIQVVVLKTYLGRWTIGRSGERGSGISVLPARYDDDGFYGGHSSLFLGCVFLSLLYPSFVFDIWYAFCRCTRACMYVCWSSFEFHLHLFFLCIWVCVLRFCLCLYVCVCGSVVVNLLLIIFCW